MFTKIYKEKFLRFPKGGCKCAVFSYDDGVEADKKLVKIFDKYGVKGTFNLNSNLFDAQEWNNRMTEEETFKTFYSSVHEVALHGARHIFLNKVPLAEAANEVLQNRLYLENKYKRVVRGMAYAYGAYNAEIVSLLKSLGVVYARTTEPSYSFDIPQNWLELKATCHHADGRLPELLNKFLSDSPLNMPKLRESWVLNIWGHSYEFDNNNNWDFIEDICSRLKEAGDVWFATCGELYSYVEAYNNLVWSLDGERVFNPSYMGVWVEIRGKTYMIPAGGEVVFDK